MADLKITGAEKLDVLARALKQYGDKGLEKELYSALNRSTKPLRKNALKAAERKLPRTGGLNRRVAAAKTSVRRLNGQGAGVRIVASGMEQLDLIDKGRVRHPVWGNRGRWVNQPIPEAKGWFTDTMKDGADDVRRELVKAIDGVAIDLARKL